MGYRTKKKEQPQETWILKSGNKPLDLQTLPKCTATAKSTGMRCGNPAMKGKRVCYIHGGRSPGAPAGNQNALKHGRYTAEAIAERQRTRILLRLIRENLYQYEMLFDN